MRYATAQARSHSKTAAAASRARHQLASAFLSDDGVDSPTYDGDIESSTTAGPDPPSKPSHPSPTTAPDHSPTSRSHKIDSPHPVFLSPPANISSVPLPVPAAQTAFINPAALTATDIQAFVTKAIQGESWRTYKIHPPPVGRPVRVYADGTLRALPHLRSSRSLLTSQACTICSILGKSPSTPSLQLKRQSTT